MLEIGQVIEGKYKIEKMLAHGGMSNIYICRNILTDREWVIKEAKSEEGDMMQSLIVEANVLKMLNHPKLPQIIDIIKDDKMFLIVMEYVPGKSLKDLLAGGARSEAEVIDWGIQLCDVFGYLHSMNPPIIYRDLKPANIILQPNGQIKLIDLGTARAYKMNSTEDTICLGTKGYAAPEQYGKLGQTDPRTDIYTIGATLFHLVTGKHPQDCPAEFPMIRNINPALSEGLENIIAKCAQTNPGMRYQNCVELREDLLKEASAGSGASKAAMVGFFASLFCGIFAAIMAFMYRFTSISLILAALVFLSAAALLAVKFRIFGSGQKASDVNGNVALVGGTGMDVGSGLIFGESSTNLGSTNLGGLIIEEEIILLSSNETINI